MSKVFFILAFILQVYFLSSSPLYSKGWVIPGHSFSVQEMNAIMSRPTMKTSGVSVYGELKQNMRLSFGNAYATVPQGSSLHFIEGYLSEIIPSENLAVNISGAEYTFAKQTKVSFQIGYDIFAHEFNFTGPDREFFELLDGDFPAVFKGELSEKTVSTIGQNQVVLDSEISIYENGRIAEANIRTPQDLVIKGETFSVKGTIKLSSNGLINFFVLGKEFRGPPRYNYVYSSDEIKPGKFSFPYFPFIIPEGSWMDLKNHPLEDKFRVTLQKPTSHFGIALYPKDSFTVELSPFELSDFTWSELRGVPARFLHNLYLNICKLGRAWKE